MAGAIHHRIQETPEAGTPFRNGRRIELACDLLRNPGRVDSIAEQILQMKFWILNPVGLGSVNVPECSTETVSEIRGIGKVPSFEMPLCTGVQNRCLNLIAQTFGKRSERLQHTIGKFSIHIHKNDEFFRRGVKAFIPCRLDKPLRHLHTERSVSGRYPHLHQGDTTIPQMGKQMRECTTLRLPRSQDDDVPGHFSWPRSPSSRSVARGRIPRLQERYAPHPGCPAAGRPFPSRRGVARPGPLPVCRDNRAAEGSGWSP